METTTYQNLSNFSPFQLSTYKGTFNFIQGSTSNFRLANLFNVPIELQKDTKKTDLVKSVVNKENKVWQKRTKRKTKLNKQK